MASEVLVEEFEVLESIYGDDLIKVSDIQLSIIVEPDEAVSGAEPLRLRFSVKFPPEYPDVCPTISLEGLEDEAGPLTELEEERILKGLKEVGNESLGMAMTFTLVTNVREQLSTILQDRVKKMKEEEVEKERKALQEEEAHTRGTPVTAATFMAWRATFLRDQVAVKARADEGKLAKMTPKEREEWKRAQARLSGRQLFEKGGERFGEEDVEKDADADAREVDASLFERVRASEREDADEERDGVVLYDSD